VESDQVTTPSEEGTGAKPTGLREIDVNVAGLLSDHPNAQNGASGLVRPTSASEREPLSQIPSFKRSQSATGKLPLPKSAKKSVVQLEGRENDKALFAQSTGRRRSPRTG
jgi:kinesin family protein 11